MRWAVESAPAISPVDTLEPLVAAATLTHRRLLWVVGPTIANYPAFADSELQRFGDALAARFGQRSVVRARQPLPGLIAAAAPLDRAVGIVTAAVEEHPYELWPLALGLDVVFDIATGRTWQANDARDAWCHPSSLPLVQAVMSSDLGRPYVREASRHLSALAEAADSGKPLGQAKMPPRVRDRVAVLHEAIVERAITLTGIDRCDEAAQRALATWTATAPTIQTLAPATNYLAAEVVEDGDALVFVRAHVLDANGGSIASARGHGDALRLLDGLPRGRWFMPRALDVLGALHDAGRDLPVSAVDPAHCAYSLNPDAPIDVANHCWSAHGLSGGARAWLGDHERRAEPPRDLDALTQMLPNIDAALGLLMNHDGVTSLLEDDIARTVPSLARIERRGAWVAKPTVGASAGLTPPATWLEAHEAALQDLAVHVSNVRAFFGDLDPARATAEKALELLNHRVMLVSSEFCYSLTAKQRLRRLEASGCADARSLARIRSLTSTTASYSWLKTLSAGPRRLRGRYLPTATGRWTMNQLPLHSLPKRSPEGKLIRSGLVGPPGFSLVAADWNAFETRLLASLSTDALLLHAARFDDLHEHMAHVLWPQATRKHRSWWKQAIHSAIYGQTADGFWKEHPKIPRADADELYGQLPELVPEAFAYRQGSYAAFRAGQDVRTRGGWLRRPSNKLEAFSTIIQGLGADILRWVLRELEHRLATVGAFLVHQAHDEVFAAAPPGAARVTAGVLSDTMDAGVRFRSGLLPRDVRLPVNIKHGMTWHALA